MSSRTAHHGYPSIPRILRYVEWTILAVLLIIILYDPDFSSWNIVPHWVIFPCLGAFAGLSFWFPLDRPIWQRRLYIVVEAALVFISQFAGFTLDILLYITITKACFLLSRRDVAITVLSFALLWLPLQIWLLPKMLDFLKANANTLDSRQIFISSVLNYTGGYIIATVFVMLFSYAMIAERKSRQRAEALSQEVETLAATLERTRIAQEIHDSLGHTLTTLDVQLEVAQKLRQRDPDRALQALDTAKQLASQSLQDVRHALHTMRSSTVNLNDAVLSLVEQVRQTHDLTIHTDLDLPRLPLQVSHQLYCVVKEGLMNVQKHSQATQVMMNSCFQEEGLLLSLSDNGIGFDPNQPYSGFGLRGMQERVELLGGTFKIHSTLGQGTIIQAIVPIGEDGELTEKQPTSSAHLEKRKCEV
jgi:signal transduction histidine kinase